MQHPTRPQVRTARPCFFDCPICRRRVEETRVQCYQAGHAICGKLRIAVYLCACRVQAELSCTSTLKASQGHSICRRRAANEPDCYIRTWVALMRVSRSCTHGRAASELPEVLGILSLAAAMNGVCGRTQRVVALTELS